MEVFQSHRHKINKQTKNPPKSIGPSGEIELVGIKCQSVRERKWRKEGQQYRSLAFANAERVSWVCVLRCIEETPTANWLIYRKPAFVSGAAITAISRFNQLNFGDPLSTKNKGLFWSKNSLV